MKRRSYGLVLIVVCGAHPRSSYLRFVLFENPTGGTGVEAGSIRSDEVASVSRAKRSPDGQIDRVADEANAAID